MPVVLPHRKACVPDAGVLLAVSDEAPTTCTVIIDCQSHVQQCGAQIPQVVSRAVFFPEYGVRSVR